ncbi:hypothetical protein QQS21_007934 [Conoideocrella luteorostrata]|uniref:Peptidoglycan-binding domain 1 protein n=1 Tax=Conoideocrella luteorostrata TaxID=1105319 RepID=A0AAJ0FWH7_9HYPO|nr:hypothetical protein QQS21_007934 [Conoideocrella luteorostrata]
MKNIFAITTAVLAASAANAAKLSQAEAEARLKPNGITASSSGGCTNRQNKSCTSYDQINSSTVDGVLTLKRASGCSSLIITGGTEIGHAGGTYSHYNGYKVDLRHQACLDNYIKNTFTKIADRSDGYPQWRAASGNLYCDEGNHWDITYF